jgi:DNA/RNA-binding domain of Phe-tRNA-synthetase-like protein
MTRPNDYRLIVSGPAQRVLEGYTAVVVWATGIDNQLSGVGNAYLRESEERIRSLFVASAPSSHPHIAAMRAAFARFGSKPSKYLCSVESLAKRSLKGDIPSISDVVDLYNSISLDYVIPVGGEDWDHLASDLVLTPANGAEPFITVSAQDEITDHPDVGELVWCDQLGVTCRKLNWRQCSRTAIRTNTRNAYFVLDGLPPYGLTELRRAAEELERRLRLVCSRVETEIEVINLPEMRA